MSSDSLPKSGGAAGIALTAMQVDVTTRLGAHSPATATGFASLDRMLSGGLRSGTVLAIAGAPGVGRTAFALLIAYMAARAKAGVVFASASLDATEVMARLAARALHREYPEAATPYGMIWSGQAWQDAATHRAVADAVETVVKKVGAQLHLYRASVSNRPIRWPSARPISGRGTNAPCSWSTTSKPSPPPATARWRTPPPPTAAWRAE